MGKIVEDVMNIVNPFCFFLQINDNQVNDWCCISQLGKLPLSTIYLERNPVANDPAYRRKLKMSIPSLNQIDATLCHEVPRV